MKISVIVPVYNVATWLRRCVDSILAQTFTDFELILVDDGSTDSSPAICDEYVSKDKRVSVLHSANAGLSSARNSGLLIASGDYISFVDSDDWISPDMLEYLYSLAVKYKCDVASADYFLTDGIAVKFGGRYKETVVTGADKIVRFYLAQDKMNGRNDFSVCIKLYKRTLFEKIRFPDGKIFEDNITNFKILMNCRRYVKSTRKVYAYFQRRQSTTKTKLTAKHLALLDVANEIKSLAFSEKTNALAERKIAMSYFSLLAMYVRYGTDLSDEKIDKLVAEYKKVRRFYLKTEISLKVHIISIAMCLNIRLCRKIYRRIITNKIVGGYKCLVYSYSSLKAA